MMLCRKIKLCSCICIIYLLIHHMSHEIEWKTSRKKKVEYFK